MPNAQNILVLQVNIHFLYTATNVEKFYDFLYYFLFVSLL